MEIMKNEPTSVVDSVAEAMSNVIVTYYKAHGFHWNVTGSDFAQFHDFFQQIYEDLYGSIDPLAELIRKQGSLAPYKLSEFLMLSDVKESDVGTSALAMAADLRDANAVTLASLVKAFDIANAQNEQGVANLLAERIDMHQKWNWQLSSYLVQDGSEMIKTDAPMPSLLDFPGRSDIASPLEALIVDEPEDDDVAEQLDSPYDTDDVDVIDVINEDEEYECTLCSADHCYCPVCICGDSCRCLVCHSGQGIDSMMLTAGGDSKLAVITFGAKTDGVLAAKVEKHNNKVSAARQTTLSMLKAVYRRGATTFSTSQTPSVLREDSAMDRVDAFLRLLASGTPKNRGYIYDNDLLPVTHPRSNRDLSAMSDTENLSSELTVTLKEEHDYASSEQAILAIAELSGHGYEMIPAIRAAWLRGIQDKESPFKRAVVLASAMYDSPDSDLLPKL